MLDFGLYCNIRKMMKKRETHGRTASINMIVEGQANENKVNALISACDRETVLSLVQYFEPTAPIQELLKARLRELNGGDDSNVLEEFVSNNKRESVSFYEYLVQLMEEKGFQTDADFYKSIGMSRQTFAKIRKHNNVSRNHALLMAVGLGLNYLEAVKFMGMAGYAFRENDTREYIICYVMRNRKYSLGSMEEILAGFGEKSLIGGGNGLAFQRFNDCQNGIIYPMSAVFSETA